MRIGLGLRLVGAATAMVAACNAIVGFDELERVEVADAGDRIDSGPEGSVTNEGGADVDDPMDGGARCDPRAPFELPKVVEALNDVDGGKSEGAVLTADELELFFVRTAPSATRTFWHGRRKDRAQPWTAAELVVESLSPVPTYGLSIAANGLSLYFHESFENYVATRSATNDPFKTSVLYAAPTVEGATFVTASNAAVYARFRTEGGADKLLGRATNNGIGASAFQVIPNVQIADASSESPVLNASETKLYFTATRTGEEFTRMGDVYVATRASKSAEFGAPKRVDELSIPLQDDTVTWVSDDDCEVFLTRAAGSVESKIYNARRPR